MVDAFIADSDDESEVNTFSPPPAAQVENLPSFASTTSEPVSLATSSTDPVFFQGIYNEQQTAAVREQRLRVHGGGKASLQLTAPTGTEQTDLVSLPSQYPGGTPSAFGDADGGHTSTGMKSAIMRGKTMRQSNRVAADPYAFPSSPEEGQSGGERQSNLSSSVAYRKAEGADFHEDDYMGPPSRKKQRLNERRNDDVDSSLPPTAPPLYSSIPPTMPPINLEESIDCINAAISRNDLIPTIDISDDPSLIIHPRGLTSSQKEQYMAVELARSSHPEQQNTDGDLSKQPQPQSSGKSQRQKAASKKSTPSKTRSSKRQAKSHPEQSAAESSDLSTLADPQVTDHTVVLCDHEADGCRKTDDQTVSETKSDGDVYEIQPTPAKPPKKKRGRPNRAEKQTQVATATPLESTESAGPGKVTKKRGRPKKSEAAVIEEQEEMAQVITDDGETKAIAVDAETAEDEAETKTDTTIHGNVGSQTASTDVKVDDEKTTVTPGVIAKETPQKPASKRIATPQTGSAGKPLYRIGLSKRSRIAPLLKSLPK